VIITVCVSIGDRSGKLSQEQWAAYCGEVLRTVRERAWEVHGEWYSLSDSPVRGACFRAAIPEDHAPALRTLLAGIRERHGQEPVTWLTGQPEAI
jgi:hypothetical protein